jgi:hypothetical protein
MTVTPFKICLETRCTIHKTNVLREDSMMTNENSHVYSIRMQWQIKYQQGSYGILLWIESNIHIVLMHLKNAHDLVGYAKLNGLTHSLARMAI